MLSTTDKGNIGQFFIMADLIQRGFVVLSPAGNHPHYDLVIEKDGIFKRVQVRYNTQINGVLFVKLFTVGHGGKSNFHTIDNVDIIAVYDSTDKKIYYLQRNEIGRVRTILSLRITAPKNNMTKNIRYARDFQELRM